MARLTGIHIYVDGTPTPPTSPNTVFSENFNLPTVFPPRFRFFYLALVNGRARRPARLIPGPESQLGRRKPV